MKHRPKILNECEPQFVSCSRALRFSCTEWILTRLAVVSNESHLVFRSLDKLLDSGFYTGEITELSGGPGSGKSQVNIFYFFPLHH